jgi:small-conductance mechanosensitive channel
MDAFWEALNDEWSVLVAWTPRIIAGVMVLVAVVLIGRVLGATVHRVLGRADATSRYARAAGRLVRWLVGLLGLVLAMHVWGLTALATSLLATGGLMAVVLGFAFRDIGENLLAGVLLAFSRSFDVGDVIESSGLRGVVRAIELRHVHIRTADGCDIFIPSAEIFRNPLHNFTRDGLRRGSFTVGIDYGDDPESAMATLLEVARTTPGVLASPPLKVEMAGFTPGYVELEVRLWVDTFDASTSLDAVRTEAMKRCRTALESGGFTFSANVTTALEMAPLDVRVAEPGTSASGSDERAP